MEPSLDQSLPLHRIGQVRSRWSILPNPPGLILENEPNIREVIAFPKDQKAKDLMLGAPSEMPKEQLTELHIKVDLKKNL